MTEDLYQSLSGAARRDSFCKQILKAIWSSAYPAYILGSNGAFLYVNTAFVHYTEKSRDKWLSLNIHNIRHTFEPSIFEQVMEQKNTITIFQNIVTASKKTTTKLPRARRFSTKTAQSATFSLLPFLCLRKQSPAFRNQSRPTPPLNSQLPPLRKMSLCAR